MESSNFPLKKTDRRSTELDSGAEQRLAQYKYAESPSTGAAVAPAYDSLLDYWQILIRHRMTLPAFVLVGRLGALAISLLQTRIYRARTSLEIQDFNANLLDLKGVDPDNSNASYVTPEAYMETQVKILQSESVLGRVIDKLNLHAERLTTGLTLTSDKQNLAENGLKQLQDELSKAQADRIASQAKFEEAKNKPVDSVPDILEDPTMRDFRQKLADLQRQYADLSATLTPEHYKVQRVQAQITELQFEMLQERTNVQRRIGNEYEAALRREKLLSQADAEQEKVVADQSSKAIHYDTLKREVDSSRQIYEAMLQRVKQAGLATAMRASNVLVVDPAKPPLRPYRPSFPINSAIGLFGGVFLGFGFVLLRERVDRRISAPGDAQTYLELPELGVIPLDEAVIARQIGNGSQPHRSPALH